MDAKRGCAIYNNCGPLPLPQALQPPSVDGSLRQQARAIFYSNPYISMHNARSLPLPSRGARPLANALHLNSTFIGIRNYFKSLSRQAKPTVYDSRPRPRHTRSFSPSTTSHAAAARPKPSQYELPTDAYFSENSPLAPATRFDWRLRATSRNHRRHDSLGKRDSAQVYMKRVLPSCTEVQPGEPLYEEIQAYRDRFVHFFIDKDILMPLNPHSFLPLLHAEQAEGESVLRKRLSSWSLSRLREEGYTITDLYAFWIEAPQFRNPIACFSLGPGIILPEHRFE